MKMLLASIMLVAVIVLLTCDVPGSRLPGEIFNPQPRSTSFCAVCGFTQAGELSDNFFINTSPSGHTTFSGNAPFNIWKNGAPLSVLHGIIPSATWGGFEKIVIIEYPF